MSGRIRVTSIKLDMATVLSKLHPAPKVIRLWSSKKIGMSRSVRYRLYASDQATEYETRNAVIRQGEVVIDRAVGPSGTAKLLAFEDFAKSNRPRWDLTRTEAGEDFKDSETSHHFRSFSAGWEANQH